MVDLKDYLIESTRLTGERRPIMVIDPHRFNDFILAVPKSPDLSPEYKSLLAILITGGLRISEGLALRKRDFFKEKGKLYFKSKVLKKGSKLKRTCLVHPALQATVEAHLSKFRAYDLLFKMTRQSVWQNFKDLFGEHACPHSIARHSYISWLLHEKKITPLEAARVVEVKVTTIESYNHPNVKATLDNLYGAA